MSKTDNRRRYCSARQGKLSIIGIGPGNLNQLTQKAKEAIKESGVVAGYKTYIALLNGLLNNKEIISSGMTEEVKRAKHAIEEAKKGKKVCVISSGDSGVYGMAGLVLELLDEKDAGTLKIEVIPGIPAAVSVASLLGAPLMHDCASISLSDLLTKKELIKKRVELAAKGDFVIALYNPKSKKRISLLRDAWRILMKYRSPNTPVGIVRNAYRDNQKVQIIKLKNMLSSKFIDMLATIIIGNSQTYVKSKHMITPRGYRISQST
ncbi:MAG: precorrin-3B C(17)-methyltransferase [Candidatus Omnitrophota bacterium]|nr:precorrin-3B C(17)-methyltransferase [Candidatus Omnitrophota bacterium]